MAKETEPVRPHPAAELAASQERLHPVAELAASLLVSTPDDQPVFSLDGAGEERLREELSMLFGVSLRHAVRDIIRLACYLDTEAMSPGAALALLGVLDVSVEPLRALEAKEAQATAPEDAGAAMREFERFRGGDPGAKAPKVGEEAPEGSIKLGSLDYPKRG